MIEYDWKRIFKESAPLLTFTGFIGVAGGQILLSVETILIDLPILLFLIPVLNGVGGNLGIVLGARISSGLHSGYIEPSILDDGLRDNINLSLILGLTIYVMFTLLIAGASFAVPLGLRLLKLIPIIFIVGGLLTISITVLTVVVTFLSYGKGLDPDNTVAPVVTTTGDFLGITFLIFGIWLVIL